jgi:ribonuclease D
VQYDNIISDRDLRDYCDRIAGAKVIAFDTEFVSEDSYQPELCLIQVAAQGRLAIIDPLVVQDLAPFWNLLAAPGKETLVHAGREEFRFCLKATGKRPSGWFDVQLAAGLIGIEYPASYGNLAYKLLGKSLSKDETRTDWRKRPLSQRQLEYALLDVLDLEAIRDVLYAELERLGRLAWLAEELVSWQEGIEEAEASTEKWRRVGGLAGMSRRTLAVVRDLWTWRDAEAERRNCPPRRILRDDLIIELAKRQTADAKRIRSLRGMEYSGVQRHLPKIADIIERSLELKDDDLPQSERRNSRPQLNLLGQFLSTALGSICRKASVAASLVGTAQDVRDLIAYRLGLGGFEEGELPALASGWRAEVVGQVIDHLLAGDVSIRIADPLADEPLAFEKVEK